MTRKNIVAVCFILILSSCNLTSDFVIQKRRYMTGYHIELPFHSVNSSFKSNKSLTDYHTPLKLIIKQNAADTTTTKDIKKIDIEVNDLKRFDSFSKNIFPPDTTKPKKADTTLQSDSTTIKKNISNPVNPKDEALYRQAKWALIMTCIFMTFPLIVCVLYSFVLEDLALKLFAGSLFFPAIGIIFGEQTRNKINQESESKKGLNYAKKAMLVGGLFYLVGAIAAVVAFLVIIILFMTGNY